LHGRGDRGGDPRRDHRRPDGARRTGAAGDVGADPARARRGGRGDVAVGSRSMAAMKWWGWGDDGIAFTDADKPALAPFIKENIGLDVRRSTARAVPFDALAVPDPALPPVLRAALEEAVGTGSVSDDPLDRVVHGRGKSLRDLVLQRRGELGRLPDAVV